MKALLIKPAEQTIESINVSDLNNIIEIIGYETIITDDIGNDGDKLHFDEDCFLRESNGRFQIDTLIPVSGNGIITGTDKTGKLSDVQLSIDEIKQRIKFM